MQSHRIIREPEFRQKLGGESHSTFWRRQRNDPNMPPKIRLGPNSVGWIEHMADQYVANLPWADEATS